MSDRPITDDAGAPKKQRTSKKKLERAAQLALDKGVRVRVGDYVIEPPGAPANDTDREEAARVQAQFDSMGPGRGR